MLNFTSKMPKFIQLKSNGFAIRSLGDTSYIMVMNPSLYIYILNVQ